MRMCAYVYDTKDMTRLIENSHMIVKTFVFFSFRFFFLRHCCHSFDMRNRKNIIRTYNNMYTPQRTTEDTNYTSNIMGACFRM